MHTTLYRHLLAMYQKVCSCVLVGCIDNLLFLFIMIFFLCIYVFLQIAQAHSLVSTHVHSIVCCLSLMLSIVVTTLIPVVHSNMNEIIFYRMVKPGLLLALDSHHLVSTLKTTLPLENIGSLVV